MTRIGEKLQRLREIIARLGSCVIAYSGGADSVLLAYVAHEVLGEKMLAVIADSPSLPRRELEEATEITRQYQIPFRAVRAGEFENPNYRANPENRCYFCKHALFRKLAVIAAEENLAVVAYGENASDIAEDRPGTQAACEFEVRAPLKEAGLNKPEIRELSRQLGLPTAYKPQMPCLSSRIPHGEMVTLEKLAMIEAAEKVLRGVGFHDVRVRHHEMRRGGKSHRLARIEVTPGEIAALVDPAMAAPIVAALKQIGYTHLTVDLEGYRRQPAEAAEDVMVG